MTHVQVIEKVATKTPEHTQAPTILGELAKVTNELLRGKKAVRAWYDDMNAMTDATNKTQANVSIVAIIASMQHYTLYNTFEINENDSDYVGFKGLDMTSSMQFAYSLEQIPVLSNISDTQYENIAHVYRALNKCLA